MVKSIEPPEHPKLTAAEQQIVEYLCKAKPWRRLSFPPETVRRLAKPGNAICRLPQSMHLNDDTSSLKAIRYSSFYMAGSLEWTVPNNRPIVRVIRFGDNIYLELDPRHCEVLFTDDFTCMLDYCHAWDDIVEQRGVVKSGP